MGTKSEGLTIWTHGGSFDWCHLCGARSDYTADVWYPDNAEHGPKGSNYVRICAICAASILNAAKGLDPQPNTRVKL